MTVSPVQTPQRSIPRGRPAARGVFLGALLVGVGMVLGRRMDPPEKADAPKSAAPESGRTQRDQTLGLAEREADRGRKARTPTEIPTKGWKDIGLRVWDKFNSDRILLISAGVTFYAILAIFPAIAALVSVYGLIADPNTINQHVNDLRGVLPDGALDIIGGQVQRLASKGGGTLGLTLLASVLLSLWSANGGVKSVFDALNIAYDETERRGFVALTLQSLVFTGGALLFVILALTGIVIVPVALQFLGLDEKAWFVALLRWPALLLILVFGLAVLYRFGPSRNRPQWRWVSAGGILAAVLWLGASALFSYYVGHFGSYNETYGSLGAAIGFMTWIWISTMVVLLGAELNAEMERQTLTDTTSDGDKPPGERRAHAADTLGRSAA
jgi:membrane protein